MVTPLRIGVLGAGMIGAWHARILAEADGADLVAVCDLDLARATTLAKPFGAVAMADPACFFALDLDGAIIATPEAVHAEGVALAAAAGCGVLIEKPLAPDLARLAAIRASVEGAGILAMAAHVERFEAGSVQLQSAVSEGIPGRVSAILLRRQFGPEGVARFAGLSSTLRILGIHDFDLLRWVHPVPVESVHAVAGRGAIHAETGMDDHVITTVRFSDGAVAMVESGWTLPRAYASFDTPTGWQAAGNNRIEVFGDKGFVSNDMGLRLQPLVAFDAAGGFRAAGLRHQPVLHGRVQGALRAEVEHFLDCLRHGHAPAVTLDDAERAIALMEAAEAALATGLPQVPAL